MKKKLSLILVLALVFSLVACSGKQEQKPAEQPSTDNTETEQPAETPVERGHVTIASGSLGGTWYPFGEAVGVMLKEAGYTYANEPGGGTANIVSVSTGAADIGMTMTTSMSMAAGGDEVFKNVVYDNVSAIMWLMDDPLHVLVSANSGIEKMEDLKGKNIGIAAAGQLSLTIAQDLLKVYGITEADVNLQYGSPADHTTMYKDGHIDAWLYIMPIPSSNAMDMAISKPSKMLQFTDEDLVKISELREGYSTTIIPAGTYSGIDEDVQALNTDVVLIVNDDAPEDLVYDITKTLVEKREAFSDALATMTGITPEKLAGVKGVKMHPGAERYYKEIGIK